MKRIIIFLLAIFLYFTLFAGDVLSGKVTTVIDGNTLEVETANKEIHTINWQELTALNWVRNTEVMQKNTSRNWCFKKM